MTFFPFISSLREELLKPLPGRSIQLAMSSNRRIRELLKFSDQSRAILSSVLILLYPAAMDGSTRLVLTLRPTYEGIHSGQISFPGGKYEKTDPDLSFTALRETQEEIGVDMQLIQLVGKLSELFIPPSNYIVQPFVGYSESTLKFTANSKEVEKIIEIRLSDLLNDGNIRKKHIHLSNGISVVAPCYVIDGNIIWGATAMMLSEFIAVAKRIAL